VAGSCEHGYEPSGCIKGGEFSKCTMHKLGGGQLSRLRSYPWAVYEQ
jgi:hypothetical protein